MTTTPPTSPTTLGDLARAVAGRLYGVGADCVVVNVTLDSRDAGPGVLFAARPGQRSDGHDHAPSAVGSGSPALLVERVLDLPVPQIVVPSVAAAVGTAAAVVHGRPTDSLLLLGVTGTNGKTTTTHLLEAALAAAGIITGVIGTVHTRIAGEVVPGVRTTPEATDLQRLFRRMVDRGVGAAAMEVSSHGLALGRLGGTRFDVAGFTNLSQDHLDFHRDLDEYFSAKARLFEPDLSERAVVVVDDLWGRKLAQRSAVPVRTVSLHADADVAATDVVAGPEGSSFSMRIGRREHRVTTRLPGLFNVANALLAAVMAEQAGVDVEAAIAGIGALPGVPGRMERVEAGQPYAVLVDYAHTPDSVENVLRAARELTSGKVVVVVGCGGDRDVGKRPLMGRAAAELADLAVLTSDNPRSEDPLAILEAVAAGAAQVARGHHTVEPDRRAAIGLALDAAEPGDVVVIAGKGHETYQELADRTIDFDDRAVARELITGGVR